MRQQAFEHFYSRDYCLLALEIAARSEAREDKPWLLEPTPYVPHLIIERAGGTSALWYNLDGIEFTEATFARQVAANQGFLEEVEKKVREGIAFIRPVYERGEAIRREELLRFIDEFLAVYPWIETMWWIKDMGPEQLGTDNSSILRLRRETESLSAGTDVVIRKSLERQYPELGVLASMIGLDEFRSETFPPREELERRIRGFTLIGGELILESLEDVARKRGFMLKEELVDESMMELSGESASKGTVRGTVCRVMGHGDFGKIQEGQILVAPMTMVDFLPEMKKAAAFVTDEGGMMSHAAIVARELGIPCVVGIRIATQVLKDGDLVEVDAQNGVVRKVDSGMVP